MLFGVGCDLCEIARMEQSLFGPHGEAFEARVFGEAERQALALDSCRETPKKAKNDHGDTVRQSALNVSRRAHKAASAAADFAAKEAFLKAAGTGLREPFALRDIEAVRLESGAPAYRRRMGGRARPPRSPLPQPRGRHGAGLLRAGNLTSPSAYNGIAPACIPAAAAAHTKGKEGRFHGGTQRRSFLRRPFARGGVGAGRGAAGAHRAE